VNAPYMKDVDAHELAQTLLALPEGSRVFCNRVMNLSVMNPEQECVGFIDTVGGNVRLEMFPPEKAS